jgi:hypothetical protein
MPMTNHIAIEILMPFTMPLVLRVLSLVLTK